MHDAIKLISTFLGSVTLIMALVLMVSIFQRANLKWLAGPVLKGFLFSFAVIMTMSDPIPLTYGGIFDMRGLLIGTAAALFGPVTGLMALATGLAMRWGIGGAGVMAGFVGMVLAFGGGLLWRYTYKNARLETWMKSVILGVLITGQLGGIFYAPSSFWAELFMELTPYTLATNILGALLINHLISGELSFQSEAEGSKIEATTDHLTGLLNRRGLEMVAPALKSNLGPNKGRALLYFDVDHFKSANDSYGHAVGDDVLKRITNRVSENLRRNDVFARMGGDEFAVILPEVDIAEAQLIAERCRAVIADDGFSNGTKPMPITISIGVIWLHEPTTLGAMLQAADEALYQAKENGRNAVVFLSKLGHGNNSANAPTLTPAA